MKRREILKAAAIGPMAVSWADLVIADPGGNAVDLFDEAARALPKLDDAERKLLDDVPAIPLNPKTRAIVRRADEALRIVARATTMPCDWGDRWTGTGFDSVMDLWMAIHPMARLIALKGRFLIEADRDPRGLDSVVVGLTLARRMGQGRVRIAHLVGLAMEHGAIAAAAVGLPMVAPADLGRLVDRFATLPSPVTLTETIRAERAFLLGYVARKEPREYDDDAIARWAAWYDRLIPAATDPAAWARIEGESKPDSEQRQLLDGFKADRSARTYIDVKRSLFLAAIAIVLNGPDALALRLDPTDGQPFDFRAWATGFELTSRFAVQEKPRANLIVGKA